MSWILPLDAAIILFRICAMVMGCLRCPSVKMPVVGGEEPRALGAQRCVLGRGERRVGGEHCMGRVARVVDGGHVRAEVGDVQRRQAVLPVALTSPRYWKSPCTTELILCQARK